MSARRLHLAFGVLSFASALLAAAGCGSFGSDTPLAPPAEASTEASTTPLDAAPDVQAGDAEVDGGVPTFCADKNFTICSDFEGVDLLSGGWDKLDPGGDLAIDMRPGIAAGHALHVKVPGLAAGANDTQALRKDVPASTSLVFAATMQMGINPVSQYTEVLSIETPQDPSDLQIIVQLLDGNLSVTEASHANAVNSEAALVALGPLGTVKATRVEVRLWFGTSNQIEVYLDGVRKLARADLKTLPSGAPTGTTVFSAGRPYTVGASGKNGGGFYLDDVTLETK